MKIALLSGAHLLPAMIRWEDEIAQWCRERGWTPLSLQLRGRIADVAYHAAESGITAEERAVIGRWQRQQILEADAVLLAASPAPEPGLAALAGWAAAQGRPVVVYHTGPRSSGEYGAPVELALMSLAELSGGETVSSLGDLYNALARHHRDPEPVALPVAKTELSAWSVEGDEESKGVPEPERVPGPPATADEPGT
jgi:nucleoside 2-deoxyribosyltransferase